MLGRGLHATAATASSKRYALITGGELRNKGAQAMTFIAVAEVKERFPELTPVLVSTSDGQLSVLRRLAGNKQRADLSNLDFEMTPVLNPSYCSGCGLGRQNLSYGFKDSLKNVLLAGEYRRTLDVYRHSALCLDISGFALGEKWGETSCTRYLDNLAILRDVGVPTYFLPQSFGPFDFGGDAVVQERLRALAAETLPSARMIFAREQDGYDAMRELCPEAPLHRSADLVLQSGELDLGAVFREQPAVCPHLPQREAKNVGIVPNMRNYDHGDAGRIDALYCAIIKELLGMGFEVCLVRHAAEDIEACERLKAMFADDPRVEVYGEDRYCFEYGELFSRCEFLVASRFHSIVHAYKEGVPCIATGWAVKYRELLASAGQEDLAFDVTADDLDEAAVLAAVHRVAEVRDALSAQIAAMVSRVQQESVFDAVEADFRRLRGW